MKDIFPERDLKYNLRKIGGLKKKMYPQLDMKRIQWVILGQKYGIQTRVRAYACMRKCKNNGGPYGFVK